MSHKAPENLTEWLIRDRIAKLRLRKRLLVPYGDYSDTRKELEAVENALQVCFVELNTLKRNGLQTDSLSIGA